MRKLMFMFMLPMLPLLIGMVVAWRMSDTPDNGKDVYNLLVGKTGPNAIGLVARKDTYYSTPYDPTDSGGLFTSDANMKHTLADIDWVESELDERQIPANVQSIWNQMALTNLPGEISGE